MSTKPFRPDPQFVPGELVVIAHCSDPQLVGMRAMVLEIHFQTWDCGEDTYWSGWGCRLDVASNIGAWWSEVSLKRLPPQTPARWDASTFIPDRIKQTATCRSTNP